MNSEYLNNGPMTPPIPIPPPAENPPGQPSSPSHRNGNSYFGKGKTADRDSFPASIRDLSKSDLARLLVYEERESKELLQMLQSTNEQLKSETLRAQSAEEQVLKIARQFKSANDARLRAEQEAARSNAELRLYKNQLDLAQQEILRAQDILDGVEKQRAEAAEEARKARAAAVKLREEMLIEMAREEGRRMGLQEGLEAGKDLGYNEGHRNGYSEGREDVERITERVLRREPTPPRSPSPDVLDRPMLNFVESETDQGPPTSRRRTLSRPASVQQQPPSGSRPPSSRSLTEHHPAPAPGTARHSAVTIPPDNYIPQTGPDEVIRLPPPHELSRPSPSPRPSPPLPPVRPEEPESIIRVVPPPASDRAYVSRRPSSQSSSSTTFSNMDILNSPRGFRASALSVIPEASPSPSAGHRSVRSSSTPVPQQQATPVSNFIPPQMYIPTPNLSASSTYFDPTIPPMPIPTIVIPSRSEGARRTDQLYTRGHSSPSSSSSDSVGIPRQRLTRMTSGSSGSDSVPDITIQPPSRPESRRHSTEESVMQGHGHGAFLSPADANRPAPLPRDPPAPVIPHMTPGGTVIDGELPPGFVPTVPPPGFVPSPSPGYMSQGPLPGSVSTGPVIPGVTTHGPNIGNPSSTRRAPNASGRSSGSASGARVTDEYSSTAGGGSGSDYTPIPYRGPAASFSAESPPTRRAPLRPQTPHVRAFARQGRDDNLHSSSSDSGNTLTTPPARTRTRASSKRNGESYAAAPTPPGVIYPEASSSSGPTPRFGAAGRRLSSATPLMGGSAPFLSFGTPLDSSTSGLPNGSSGW